MAKRNASRRAKVTVREIQPGLYHVHENPRAATRASRKFERALESEEGTAQAENDKNEER